MRTTIDIPDPMYRRLKARASAEGRSVKAVLLDAAEHVLSGSESAPRRAVRLPLVKSKRPGSLRLDNAAIYDIISFP
jgi:plasmid stability protein